jgi:hypothetical protein
MWQPFLDSPEPNRLVRLLHSIIENLLKIGSRQERFKSVPRNAHVDPLLLD